MVDPEPCQGIDMVYLNPLYQFFQLRRSQWLDPEALEGLRKKRLQRLVKHAYEKVLYYRRLFDSVGIRPGDIETPEDLSKIPMTTKKQIQDLNLEQVNS